MKPKNHKFFFESVANEIGVHKDVVDDIITFYYAKVRKSLSELKDVDINVIGLGTFVIRKRKLEKAIKKNKDILGNLEKMTFKGYDKYVPVKNKLKEMENALEILNKKLIDKNNFKNESR